MILCAGNLPTPISSHVEHPPGLGSSGPAFGFQLPGGGEAGCEVNSPSYPPVAACPQHFVFGGTLPPGSFLLATDSVFPISAFISENAWPVRFLFAMPLLKILQKNVSREKSSSDGKGGTRESKRVQRVLVREEIL